MDNAQDLINQPKPLEDDLLKRFNSAIQAAGRYGLTSIHDAGLDPISLNLFKKLVVPYHVQIYLLGFTVFIREDGRRRLPVRFKDRSPLLDIHWEQIRIYGMSYFDETEDYWGNTTKPIIASGNGRLTARSVKIFADGECLSFENMPVTYDSPFLTGALRTGGAAVKLFLFCCAPPHSVISTAIRALCG